ncbi:MAG: MOSC domain-containing protein [Akkermansiaceae bacterium]
MQVTIKHLYISNGHNYFGRYGKGSLAHEIEERNGIELVSGSGVRDDRFFDYEEDYKGQITFFDWAVYERVRDEVVKGDLEPSKFRRNVVLEGVDLNRLIGKRFSLGGIEFTGSGECKPCFWMDEACADGAFESLKGRGGLRARILNDGELSAGSYELEILGDVIENEEV